MKATIDIGGGLESYHGARLGRGQVQRLTCTLVATAVGLLVGLRPVLAEAAANAPASTEWYETGIWPLVGSVAVIVISNAVAIWLVHLSSASNLRAVLKERKIERLSASLSEFYDPISALLEVNSAVFKSTGPPSFPSEHIEREVAASVWSETKKKILDNNREIEEILTKSRILCTKQTLYQSIMIFSFTLRCTIRFSA